MKSSQKYLTAFAIGIVLLAAATSGAIADRLFVIKPLDLLFPRSARITQKIISEESIVTQVAQEASKSVVTVAVEVPERRVLELSPFGGFESRIQDGGPEDIGTGFVVDEGLIVTNKHVVSQEAEYKVVSQDGTEYEVEGISRDPSNDIAILRIEAAELPPLKLGDSNNLKVGQFVIAIGTALGEFRHTVTTGVISGLGRGITAGSAFQGFVERLDNVIQTDAAINPGNSGGPLINSSGEVIGVNVALAQGAQNIGFAIPINTVKEGIAEFQRTGRFAPRPFLGVSYQTIPQGALVLDVVADSAADVAGIQVNDIITKFDRQVISRDNALTDLIRSKKIGDLVEIEVLRGEEIVTLEAVLEEFSQ